MSEQDRLIAQELKIKISQFVKFVDFRVFGSRAKGNNVPESDMDVFMEVESLNKEIKNKIYDASWEVGFENFMVISPLIFTFDEVTNSPLRASPILKNILSEGIQI